MQQDRLVSVIIPTYNRAQYIGDSVKSVLDQTYSKLEILVVDDGSTDNTEEVVAVLSDPRVKYVKLPENRGAAGARNYGVQAAAGETIAFQDSDDIWHPDKLEKQMSYWETCPEYCMIYSAYILQRLNDEAVKVPYAETWGNLAGDIFETLLVNNTVGTPTMVMRKECFAELGGFDESMECLEDWDFAVRFAEKYRVGFIEEPLVDAHLIKGGISSDISNFYLNRCRMIVKYRKQLLDRDLFNRVTGDMLLKAQKMGVLEQVQSMLVAMLS